MLKNFISDGNTGDAYDTCGTYTGSSHVSADDATATDVDATNGSNSQTFTFQTGADIFLLDTTDASAANDGGTTLAADSIFAFDEDILGATWNVWDQGINEPDVAAAGAPPPSLVTAPYRAAA